GLSEQSPVPTSAMKTSVFLKGDSPISQPVSGRPAMKQSPIQPKQMQLELLAFRLLLSESRLGSTSLHRQTKGVWKASEPAMVGTFRRGRMSELKLLRAFQLN